MKNLSIMIKPASGGCNLRCKYCFYADITEHREVASYGKMSEATLETLVKKVLEESEESCTFVFQGGEPTLAGLDFFRSLTALQQRYRKNTSTWVKAGDDTNLVPYFIAAGAGGVLLLGLGAYSISMRKKDKKGEA